MGKGWSKHGRLQDNESIRTQVNRQGDTESGGAEGGASVEHRTPAPPEVTPTPPTPEVQSNPSLAPTPEVQSHPSLPATLSQGEGVTPSSFQLWDRSNTEQSEIVSLSEQYRNVLKDKLSELTENVDFSPLVPHLLQLDVINKQTRDTIQLNATRATQTLRLVEHLERGPCWRMHGFLRALTLTQQSHLVTLLGLDPHAYEDVKSTSYPSEQQKQHFYKHVESEEKLQISNDLLPGLLQHCGSYNKTLLKSSIFGHKDTIPIDLTQVWVIAQARCDQDQSTCESIGKMEMFKKLFQRHPPHTVSLEGAAGAGKSSFMEDYAYTWSKDVTACQERGVGVPCQGHLWKLVLYIPLGSIRGTFTDTIQDNLRCDPHLQQQMMAEIYKDGEGVLVIGDGIDELRDQTSKQSLCDYTKTCKDMVGKPKVLITARDGLLSIPRSHFDRELYVKGFTLEQGVTYLGNYYQVMHQISEHPVLDYTRTHQEELTWVLTNPLQAHIYSELTATGFLTLDDVRTLTTIKLFRSLDHLMMTRDEDCRGADAGPSNFYKACLRCLLHNERQVTEEKVGSGCLYLSLLTKSTYRDQDYKECHRYGFPHEMVFEFYAMRGVLDYIKSNPTNKKSLLLYLCSDPNMQNVLRLTCGFITQYEREMFPDTVVAIIRCCLLLCTEIQPCVKNELTRELPTLSDQIQGSNLQDLLTRDLTTDQRTKMDRTFDLIQQMFTERDDCLKKYGWAPTKAKKEFWGGRSPLHRFIVTCVEQCTPADQAAVLQRTTEHLLPCATHDCHPDYDRYVVPANGRFGRTEMLYGTTLRITTWCPQDLLRVLQTHTQLHQLQQDAHYSHLHTQIGRLPLTQQCEHIMLDVNYNMEDLWGSAPAGWWSEEEWTPALTQLLLQYDMRYIDIVIADHAPLGGLMAACRKTITHGHKVTQGLSIRYGKVQEEELLVFLDWAHDVGLDVCVRELTVVLAAGRDPALWQDVHSAIRQKAHLVRGDWLKNVRHPTYVSASGQVLCEKYKDYR